MEYKHGEGKTKLYRVWSAMRDRCNNPRCKDYKYYGGKGVHVSPEWDEFLDFKRWAIHNGYQGGVGLSIDRIDPNGNYEPGNCRWVTWKTQTNNMTSNHKIEYNGETHTLTEWGELKGIDPRVLEARINSYHWDIAKALETPVNSHRITFEIGGRARGLKDLAKEYGINYQTLYNRLFSYGYSIERALGITNG